MILSSTYPKPGSWQIPNFYIAKLVRFPAELFRLRPQNKLLYKITLCFLILNSLAILEFTLLCSRAIFTGDPNHASIYIFIRKLIFNNSLWTISCMILVSLNSNRLNNKSFVVKLLYHISQCFVLASLYHIVMTYVFLSNIFPDVHVKGSMLNGFIMTFTGQFQMDILFYLTVVSLNYFVEFLSVNVDPSKIEDSTTWKDKIRLKIKGRSVFINVSEIIAVKSLQNYIEIFVQDNPHPILHRGTLRDFLHFYGNKIFRKVHRSYIINIYCIEEIINESGSRKISLKMSNGNIIPVSRNNKSELLKALKDFNPS